MNRMFRRVATRLEARWSADHRLIWPAVVGRSAPRSASRVLHEVGDAVARGEPRAGVPAASEVATHRTGTVVGGAGRAVPEVGIVEDHVAALGVDRELAVDLLEAEGH